MDNNNQKKSNKWLLTLIGLLIVGCFLFFLFYNKNKSYEYGYIETDIYFFNSSNNSLEVEKRVVENLDNDTMIGRIYEELLKGPRNKKLSKTVPNDDIFVNSKTRVSDDKSILIEFDNKYRELPSYKEIIFRSSLVWSLTGLDFVENVKIYVGDEVLIPIDEPISSFSRTNVLLNPTIAPSPFKNDAKIQIALYYPDITNKNLVVVEKAVLIDDVSKNIVDELIKGPDQTLGLTRVFPDSLKIKSVEKGGYSVAFVNFSSDFLSAISTDPEIEKLQIYSIVNTLTSPSFKTINYKYVQFLVEEKRIKEGSYLGKLDINQSFEFNQDLVK